MQTTQKMKTVIKAVEAISAAKPVSAVREILEIPIGKLIHQGDVYLHRVADDHPRGKALGTRQVAVGTTIGSRHIVEGAGVEVFEGREFQPSQKTRLADLLGPVVVASGPFTLTHPEHAHHALPPGTYQVTYQLDLRHNARQAD